MTVPSLDLPFVSEEIAAALARDLGEPDWLRDERVAAARLVAQLPAETNPLFTPYLDLRGARFGEIEPYAETGVAPRPRSPVGTAGRRGRAMSERLATDATPRERAPDLRPGPACQLERAGLLAADARRMRRDGRSSSRSDSVDIRAGGRHRCANLAPSIPPMATGFAAG